MYHTGSDPGAFPRVALGRKVSQFLGVDVFHP